MCVCVCVCVCVGGGAGGIIFLVGFVQKGNAVARPYSEPVWPSDKALGWKEEGPRFDTASALLSPQNGFGLWTLSCDFVHHFLLKH